MRPGSKPRISAIVKSSDTSPAKLNVADLLSEFRTAGSAQGFRVEEFGRIDLFPLLALTKRTPGPRPRIYLSAGIHGDEPAPPLTLLAMLREGCFGAEANWFICPALNPVGLQTGTREDAQMRDLNRDYQDKLSVEVQAHTGWLQRQAPFELALCLHEDWESTGFYLYELNPTNRPSLAPGMINAVEPIIPIDPAGTIDGRPAAEPGIIRPISDPLLRENWPEAIYLRQAHTTLSYTLETPSAFTLEQRVSAMQAAITAAITRLINPD